MRTVLEPTPRLVDRGSPQQSRWYLTGILVPSHLPPEQSERDDAAGDATDVAEHAGRVEEDHGARRAARNVHLPSSMRLSCLVAKGATLPEVVDRWGDDAPTQFENDAAWPRFEFERASTTYHVVLHEEQGVLRLERPRPDVIARFGRTALAGAAGAGVGALLATLANATEKKGSAAQLGLLLGLVVGAVAEGAAASAPQRVFALEFDPRRREWLAYDGGLLHWMRERLLPA